MVVGKFEPENAITRLPAQPIRESTSIRAPSAVALPKEAIAADGVAHGRSATAFALANIGLLLTLVTIGGLTPVATKFAMREMPTFSTGVLRFSIASSLLWLTARCFRGRDPRALRPIEHADCPRILLCAFLCVPVNQACYLNGVALANASHSGLLYALNPVLVFLFTLALRTTRFSWRMMAATSLAFAGAAVVGIDGLMVSHDALFFRGDLCLFAAVSSWALYSALIGTLGEKYGPVRMLALIMLAGTAMYLPAVSIDGGEWLARSFSRNAWAGFAFITVLTAYLNYMLWFISLTRMSVNRLAVAMNAGPIIAVVSAHLICDEPLTRWLLVGAALILSAILLSNWGRLRMAWRGV